MYKNVKLEKEESPSDIFVHQNNRNNRIRSRMYK